VNIEPLFPAIFTPIIFAPRNTAASYRKKAALFPANFATRNEAGRTAGQLV